MGFETCTEMGSEPLTLSGFGPMARGAGPGRQRPDVLPRDRFQRPVVEEGRRVLPVHTGEGVLGATDLVFERAHDRLRVVI